MNSNSEWKKCKWGDISTLEYGKALRDYKGNTKGYPVYGTNGLIGYTESYLSEKPGVIIGRKGAYRGVHYSRKPFYVIDTAYYLKPKIEQLDLKWAYYNLRNKDINNLDSGSAIPSTSRSDFYSLEVELPEINEQIEIANLLSALDDKIELNNAINKNLEEIAQALFKSWFVDFEFPNENREPYKSSGGEFEESEFGLIPKGWEISSLGQIIKVKHGFAFKSENFSEEKTNRILLTPGNFKIGGGFNDNKLKYYSIQADVPPDYILNSGDMLITMTDLSKSGDTLGYPAILPNISDSEILHNQRLGRVIFYTDLPIRGYVYNVLCSNEYRGYILGSATGSTVKHTAPNRIESYKVLIPNKDLLQKFDNIMSNVFDKLSLNYAENRHLSMLRDTLLPKLMSGEIRVPAGRIYRETTDLPLAAESKAQYSTT